MDSKDADFLKRLQGVFKVEAQEHIRAVTTGLLDLATSPAPEKQQEIIESVFREIHTLKGSARSVGLKEIESICHPMETVFAALKQKDLGLTSQMLNLLHRCVDFIAPLVVDPGVAVSVQIKAHVRELIQQLEDAVTATTLPTSHGPAGLPEAKTLSEPDAPSSSSSSAEKEVVKRQRDAVEPAIRALSDTPSRAASEPHLAATVRIPTGKLDPLLYQAEEMIMAKLSGMQRTQELQNIHRQLIAWKTESGKWQNRLFDAEQQQVNEFFEWNNSIMKNVQTEIFALTHLMEQDQRSLRRMVDEHLEAMKQVLMLPVSALTESFPKIVRDLAYDQGKEVDLVLAGVEIEIDKRILEDLKTPLMHLLRNCVDHGMKKPQDRAARKKSPRGTIQVTCTATENRQVEILIADDGEGIDLERVRAAAVKAGILANETAEKLSRDETLPLIFRSGLSTSPIITNISGRGLGMTIVREKVEKLGGHISVETETGHGTTFRIVAPLTLATFRGVLVRSGESLFVLPATNVERVVRVPSGNIMTVENRETISLDDRILSIVKLSRALELPVFQPAVSMQRRDADVGPTLACIVVLKLGETRLGFQVDEVLAEHQVLVKSLGKQLSRVRNIAGATVLGTGKMVLILNVPDLMKSAVRTVVEGSTEVSGARPATRGGKILAADDSITARTLIKNILENAGYQVKYAVDGAEAFALAKSEDFDLIVSDVDMPRMSGFELAAKIRADKKLSELPIVLVTALDSREDRERGIDVGANAYIVKSSFNQSNLLEVIKSLLY